MNFSNWGFDGAALFGVDVAKGGWLFEGEDLWASVSASRRNRYVKISTDAYYGTSSLVTSCGKTFPCLQDSPGMRFAKHFGILGGYEDILLGLASGEVLSLSGMA